MTLTDAEAQATLRRDGYWDVITPVVQIVPAQATLRIGGYWNVETEITHATPAQATL